MKEKLDNLLKSGIYEISQNKPDPILIAYKYKNEYAALIAALFAYGNVKAIMKLLNTIDYENLNSNGAYYRFQKQKDINEFLYTLKIMRDKYTLNELFLQGYSKTRNPIMGIKKIIETMYEINPYTSRGYRFLVGTIPTNKTKHASPYKRWNMFLRWVVRKNTPDLGLWEGVDQSDLIIPLDTHTHKVSLRLGLLKRKSYDLQAAIELTQKLKEFDPYDPLKYDFALYRIGQMKLNL